MSKKEKAVKTMVNLEMHDCRWPIGDPRQEGFHFCGAQQVAGRPYCAAHCAISFEVSRPRHQAPSRPALVRSAA